MARRSKKMAEGVAAGKSNADMFNQDLWRSRRQYGTKKTQGTMETFLAVLAEKSSTVSKAAHAAGVSVDTLYRWKSEDKAFSEAWEFAYDEGTDRMEDEATRRAVDGIDKGIYYQGELAATEKEYSDTLLQRQLAARRPQKYKSSATVEATGNVTVVVNEFEDRRSADRSD